MKYIVRTLLAFLLVFIPLTAQADGNWIIKNFDSQLTIQSDGKVDVVETIEADFGSVAKHGIYRFIPIKYKIDGSEEIISTKIDVKEVTQDGHQIEKVISTDTAYVDSAYLNIKIGDPDRTITGRHAYKIHYLATGVLRGFTDFDELYWNVTGDQWEIPIEKATATVKLPSGDIIKPSCYQGSSGSDETCQVQGNNFSATRQLEAGEGMTIAVGYPTGLVPLLVVEPPKTLMENLLTIPSLVAFLLPLLIGGFVLYRKWWQGGRDAAGQSISKTVVAEYEPPAGLRPAEIGLLIDERADTLDVTSTIVDLAVRGYLTIKEEPRQGLLGKVDYLLERTDKGSTELLSYEKTLLDGLFKDGKEVKISALKYTFYEKLEDVKNGLYSEVAEKKELFAKNPSTVRNDYLMFGFILAIPAGVLTFIGANLNWGLLAAFGAGTVLVGLLTVAVSRLMPARTAQGRELYRQAQGYKLFIETADKYRVRFEENQNLFSQVLPYAMMFGVTEKFAQAMKNIGLQNNQPSWYYGPHPFSPVIFANDVSSFSNTFSSNAAATVSSSSGSGGGGFSGGGFGGGGGGSW